MLHIYVYICTYIGSYKIMTINNMSLSLEHSWTPRVDPSVDPRRQRSRRWRHTWAGQRAVAASPRGRRGLCLEDREGCERQTPQQSPSKLVERENETLLFVMGRQIWFFKDALIHPTCHFGVKHVKSKAWRWQDVGKSLTLPFLKEIWRTVLCLCFGLSQIPCLQLADA